MKMSKTKKTPALCLVMGAVILLTAHFNAFPLIYHNGSGSGFGSPSESVGISNPVEALIIEGAGYYFQANTFIQLLLNRVELQDINGIDNAELAQLADNALDSINLARSTYRRLIKTAGATPYNQTVIHRLKNFAYDTFMMNNGLNPVTFRELKSYLSRGDITGTFRRSYRGMCMIHRLLTSIKMALSKNRPPGMHIYWKLNETCANTTLFGSYSARLFREINSIKSE
jgi:hypothetical protein